MGIKFLLIISAALEGPTGLLLLFLPSVAFSLLLGVSLETPAGLVAARLAGAAILALAVACWQTRDSDQGGTRKSVITAMLCYNVAATAVLAYAGIRLEMQSRLLWPVMVLHSVLALWCVLSVWTALRKAAQH
ncbi:MAG TPA: hypothetical protein VJV03_11765 [Pyrinomonadaceae bacterium]|nr:hypothetical protein [Pyrinomonadaceae bacterium]